MSAEQIRGSTMDGRADLYSLGATLYEALAGRPPFAGRTPDDIWHRHLHDPAPSLEDLERGIPPALARTIHRFFSKDPAERPPHAGALEEDLLRLARSLGPEPSGPLDIPRTNGEGWKVEPREEEGREQEEDEEGAEGSDSSDPMAARNTPIIRWAAGSGG